MNTPFKALNEMIRLSSPFPESIAIKDWKASGKKVIGWINPYIPEEIIAAAGMLPFQISGNNEQVDTHGADAYISPNSCSFIRTLWQMKLDKKFDFLDGLVSSCFCDQDKRLNNIWEHYDRLPYMEEFYAPRKRDDNAEKLYLAALENFRTSLSKYGQKWISDHALTDAILMYDRGRKMIKQLYELRKRDRPPVTGTEALEVNKAAAKLPRILFNELMEQLLDEIIKSGREIRASKRLMIIGNDIHNASQIEALESEDAVVVMDEMNSGTRYSWSQVETDLPPMEAIAHYYIFGRPVDMHNIDSEGRLEFINEMIEEFKVDEVLSQTVCCCTYNGWDKYELKKQMDQRGIPLREFDLEYGQPN